MTEDSRGGRVTTDATDSRPAVLVVTMGTDYVAPARMPCELQRAGFRVGVLAPRRSFAACTAYVDEIGFFPDGVKLHEWVGVIAGSDPRSRAGADPSRATTSRCAR
jgi:hypothetical protein